ncbi:MAG: hypothetical protein ACFFCS_02585 [Candidatus Hodarchaeota archaeon]
MTERRIHFRYLNIALPLILIILSAIALIVDFYRLVIENVETKHGILAFVDFFIPPYTTKDIVQILGYFLNIAACVVFFYVALRYKKIRETKKDKYLSSLIYFSIVYQGISRLFELFYISFRSDLKSIRYVVGQYYFPLDILGIVFFSMVAFQVFYLPKVENPQSSRIVTLMQYFAFIGLAVGIALLFFVYENPIGVYSYTVCFIGLGVFCVITIILIFVSRNIFRIAMRFRREANFRALLVIGIQVMLFLAAFIFMIISEVGSAINIDSFVRNLCRTVKLGLYLTLALLYIYSFVKTSTQKDES